MSKQIKTMSKQCQNDAQIEVLNDKKLIQNYSITAENCVPMAAK